MSDSNGDNGNKDKPFKLTAADGSVMEVPAGEYYFNTKARCRRMIENHLSPEARRVYACLELGTMGFRQEKAVVMTKDGIKAMTPSYISKAAGISKQNTRRAIEELECAGLAERRPADGGSLKNGNVELYSWAFPRAGKDKKGSQRATTFPAWFPPCWEPLKKLVTRYKYRLPDQIPAEKLGVALDYLVEHGAELARDYQKAEEVVCAFLEGVCAQVAINKEERTERTTERTEESSPQSSSILVDVPVPSVNAVATATENPKAYSKITTTTTPEPANPSQEGRPPEPPPAEPRFRTDRDELIDLIHQSVGQLPDKRLLWGITQQLEIRNGNLREYLDDIKPRLVRLRGRPKFGFFLFMAESWNSSGSMPVPPPEIISELPAATGRCLCQGTGRLSDGAYCDCSMGKDLARVERKLAKLERENPHAEVRDQAQ